jgi:hypothetical protein
MICHIKGLVTANTKAYVHLPLSLGTAKDSITQSRSKFHGRRQRKTRVIPDPPMHQTDGADAVFKWNPDMLSPSDNTPSKSNFVSELSPLVTGTKMFILLPHRRFNLPFASFPSCHRFSPGLNQKHLSKKLGILAVVGLTYFV